MLFNVPFILTLDTLTTFISLKLSVYSAIPKSKKHFFKYAGFTNKDISSILFHGRHLNGK